MEVRQTFVGAKWNYRLAEPIVKGVHNSTVFKAEMLPGNDPIIPSKWALIKTASPNDDDTKKSLRREYNAYQRDSIAKSANFRIMYDIVGDPQDFDSDKPPCLALEWMDCTLADVSSEHYRRNYALLEAILNAGLSGFATLHEEKLVHTDCKPANILLSDVDTDHPTVKIGDLGLIRLDGFTGLAQPVAMRAPEVYQGCGCRHPADIWSLAVTLFDWIKPGVFGRAGIIEGIQEESWCIAKLMLLFPGWTGQPANDAYLERLIRIGKLLINSPVQDNPDEKIVLVSSLEEEMQTMGMPSELEDLFRFLFVPDPKQRPSATKALASDQFQALKEAALEGKSVGT